VARHIFQACPVWIYTQSNITQATCYYYYRYKANLHFTIFMTLVIKIRDDLERSGDVLPPIN
jgi:hypothetical protein